MRVLLLLALAAGCGSDPPARECRGAALFGRPGPSTGLSDSQCGPRCDCAGEPWEAPSYTAADADALLAWTLSDPPAELAGDPYAAPAAPVEADSVCGFHPGPGLSYRLETHASAEAAERAGAAVTHFGVCGLCSSLADLAAYMRHPDLTTPVRQCGLDHFSSPAEEHVACLEALGFTRPCAQIWYHNTVHTRTRCGGVCFAALNDPYHLPDGQLNECLACDEAESGPVFKAVAGRTRRNTGLASALCRPCSEVQPIEHTYALDAR
jgi:hypothetical protein